MARESALAWPRPVIKLPVPPARPERAAFGALQQDDHDERDDDQDMNDDQNGLHEGLERPGAPGLRAGLLERWRAPNMAQGGRPWERARRTASAVGGRDGQKFRRFQARAADQRAVDIVESQKLPAIARLDGPAIEKAHPEPVRAIHFSEQRCAPPGAFPQCPQASG